MIRLKLSNKSANEGINLDLPATPAEIGEAFSWFERIGVDLSTVRIAGVNSPVPTLGRYILRADIPTHEPDPLTAFLDLISRRLSFHYWLFGHYHDNQIIQDKYVLLWEQIVQIA